jgi:glycosyltransferase involved in cell wall biosynthesis
VRTLRIVQVSTFDVAGGAEKTAKKLHDAFRERGHASLLVVGHKISQDADIAELDNSARGRGISGRLKTLVERRLGVQYVDYPGSHRIPELVGRPWDVTHIHNLHGGYFDVAALPRLAEETTTVLTLQDMWLLTGHCAHSLSCSRWRQGCGSCPDLTIYPAVNADGTRFNLWRKARLLRNVPLAISSPAGWLLDCVAESYLRDKPKRRIPNPVDTRVFRPGDKLEARRQLRLPLDRPIVLLPAHAAFLNPWKDAAMFENAVQTLREPRPLGIAFGLNDELRSDDISIRAVGSEESAVARYFQAADVVVCPSHAETFPLTILEAFATARPVVATRVGGIPELIADGSTGLLVDAGDTRSFTSAVRTLLNDPGLAARLGAAGLDEARGRYDLGLVADMWLDWYGELAAGRENQALARPRRRAFG